MWDTIDGVADSISLRFRTNGLPFNTSSIEFQSLWNIDGTRSHLVLRYEGTGYTSGSSGRQVFAYSGVKIGSKPDYSPLPFGERINIFNQRKKYFGKDKFIF